MSVTEASYLYMENILLPEGCALWERANSMFGMASGDDWFFANEYARLVTASGNMPRVVYNGIHVSYSDMHTFAEIDSIQRYMKEGGDIYSLRMRSERVDAMLRMLLQDDRSHVLTSHFDDYPHGRPTEVETVEFYRLLVGLMIPMRLSFL